MSHADMTPPQDSPIVSWREAWWTWLRVALLSFGGPAGQIAVMHRIIVEEKHWISEERFLHALNYCMLLPGPEAQQLAVYIGWIMHRKRGGLLAGGLFILPGFIAILTLSMIYALYGQVGIVAAIFGGLKPAIIAVVIEAVLRIGKRVLKNGLMVAIAVAAFIAVYFGRVPFPAIVLTAGLLGAIGSRIWPQWFLVLGSHAKKPMADLPPPLFPDGIELPHMRPSLRRLMLVLASGAILWFAPLIALAVCLSPDHVLVEEGIYFSKAAMVTFGGAYAVLDYVRQDAVLKYRWLSADDMLVGLGMAETTPGPLILVLQFVGFMGAYHLAPQQSGWSPLVSGIAGACITVWTTFVPCFIWIFAGAPYIERTRHIKAFNAALSAITAAVVGCVLNLAVWFSGEVLWPQGQPQLDAILIAGFACAMLLWFRRGIAPTLIASVAMGIVLWLMRGR